MAKQIISRIVQVRAYFNGTEEGRNSSLLLNACIFTYIYACKRNIRNSLTANAPVMKQLFALTSRHLLFARTFLNISNCYAIKDPLLTTPVCLSVIQFSLRPHRYGSRLIKVHPGGARTCHTPHEFLALPCIALCLRARLFHFPAPFRALQII